MAIAPTPETILDAALRCAADCHWEQVRLADVATALDVSLVEIHRHFADKESLVDALWDRADRSMLSHAHTLSRASPVPDQIEALVFAWLAALAPHRRTVREMLLVRLEPGHLHIQLPTLLRISKTVQWLREAAGLRAAFAWRALEESVLTALFVTTVLAWLRDGGDASARNTLRNGLRAAHEIRSHIGPKQNR